MASAGSKESKALYLVGFGGYDKLQVKNREIPVPKQGEVQVNIKAVGINFAELMMRMGIYDRLPKLPAVVGFEGAGEVTAVGEGVQDVKVGQRVMIMNERGSWAEHITLPSTNCFQMPEKMTYEEAAAIPVNYITAYHMLFDMGNLRPGNSVLVHMVAGGVGHAATQLIRTVPDTVIFGTCSASKHEYVKQHGVNHPIDYRTKDYVAEIRNIAPGGVDIVLDPLNGPDAVKGYNLLKPFGKIIHFGAANTVTGPNKSLWQMAKTWYNTKTYNPLFMISSNKGIFGYHLGHLIKHPEMVKSAASHLLTMYDEGKIKPTIDSVWAFEDVGKAMARMHDRKNIGKVILSPQKNPGEIDIRSELD